MYMSNTTIRKLYPDISQFLIIYYIVDYLGNSIDHKISNSRSIQNR